MARTLCGGAGSGRPAGLVLGVDALRTRIGDRGATRNHEGQKENAMDFCSADAAAESSTVGNLRESDCGKAREADLATATGVYAVAAGAQCR